MKLILQNKLLMILTIFLVLVSAVFTSSFASENNVVSFHLSDIDRDVELVLPSGYGTDYKYYFVTYFFNNYSDNYEISFKITLSNEPLYCHNRGSGLAYYNSNFTHFTALESNFSNLKIYKSDKSKVVLDLSLNEVKNVSSYQWNGFAYEGISAYKNIAFSNYTIYDYQDRSKVVFQGAPQGITQALVEQATQLGMKPLVGIKEIILVVIVTIVGLIAFWKAWQLLSKQLRKA